MGEIQSNEENECYVTSERWAKSQLMKKFVGHSKIFRLHSKQNWQPSETGFKQGSNRIQVVFQKISLAAAGRIKQRETNA